MGFRTISTRLADEKFILVTDYCKRKNTTPSALIKDLLSEEINFEEEVRPNISSNIAGRNIIEYDSKRDLFEWKIELDSGKRITVMSNVSPEYVKDLKESVSGALTTRDELQGKKKKGSVPVPKRMLRVRK